MLQAKPPALVLGPGSLAPLDPELSAPLDVQLDSSQPSACNQLPILALGYMFPAWLGLQLPTIPGLQSSDLVVGSKCPALLGPQLPDLG